MNRAIPLARFAELEPLRRRTAAVRLALAVVVAAFLACAAVLARHPAQHEVQLLPQGSNGIVVLDLSASISSDTFQRIGTTLHDLAGTNGRYGLIVFSDVAYHALPPGTPARELGAYARFFTLPPATGNGFLPQFPANPWTSTFSGGTRISAGLGLALQTIRDDHLSHAGVILVSDLDDDPGDLQNLASVALAYRHLHVPVRIVALNPQPSDAKLFTSLLAGAARLTEARLPGEPAHVEGGALPLALLALVAAAAVALAIAELWSAELAWGEAR